MNLKAFPAKSSFGPDVTGCHHLSRFIKRKWAQFWAQTRDGANHSRWWPNSYRPRGLLALIGMCWPFISLGRSWLVVLQILRLSSLLFEIVSIYETWSIPWAQTGVSSPETSTLWSEQGRTSFYAEACFMYVAGENRRRTPLRERRTIYGWKLDKSPG